MKYKILIVDDDQSICEILEFNLRSEGFEVMAAHSAEEALTLLTHSFHVILLDVMMGGMSGYKMAEELRKGKNDTPIIFLTAKDTENDMLTGFSVGGDDYISKPFSIKEVIARVRSILRRTTPGESGKEHSSYQWDGLKIDRETKEITMDGEPIALTKTETELLILLMEQRDRILSRAEIIDKIWGEASFITERSVDVHIARLRKKLGRYASFITNRSGYGYRFNPSALCD